MQKRAAVAATASLIVVIGATVALGALADSASPSVVVLGGSGAAVSPLTATQLPGGSLQFHNVGSLPYVVKRSASPFQLGVTVSPMSTSSPLAVPTSPGTFGYTAQAYTQPPGLLGVMNPPATPTGSAFAADVEVSPMAAQTEPASPSTSAAPSTSGATPATRRTTARAVASASSTASGLVSASPTDSEFNSSILPGEALPAPAGIPSFDSGSPVPLPELPSAVETAESAQAALPFAVQTTDEPAPSASPEHRIAADAPRMGPRRSRGLPIAIAVVLLLGVGGAVVRAAAALGGPGRLLGRSG